MKKILYLLISLFPLITLGCDDTSRKTSDFSDYAIIGLKNIKDNIVDEENPSSITIASKYYENDSLIGEVNASYDEEENIYHEVTLANNNEAHVYLHERIPLTVERLFAFKTIDRDLGLVIDTFIEEEVCTSEEEFDRTFKDKLDETATPYISRYYLRLGETVDNLINILQNAIGNIKTYFDVENGIYEIETYEAMYTYNFDGYNLVSYSIEKGTNLEEHIITFDASINPPEYDADGGLIL